VYGDLFKRLRQLDISEDVGEHVLAQIRRSKALLGLSELAFKVKQGFSTQEDLDNLWKKEFDGVLSERENDGSGLSSVSTDLEALLDGIATERGFRWRLGCLNASLGSLRRGDFGFVFARPETGKTTFLASEVTHMLDGSGQAVVWFNNEEQGTKVMLRVYQAFFGASLEQLMANPKKYKDAFYGAVGNRFHLLDSAVIHRRDVEKVIARINPGVVVYDQIDKIKGFNNDRDDLRLGSIYQWARELAKGSHASIGVCQADGHAEGVRYLTMEHVSNAKTSKQAEADFIIGIGKIHDNGAESVRYLNISKNKLMGDPDSIPDLRHGRFEVLIDAQVARYRDVVKYD
jgi:KaiC/GvpD/RAD55 family RecA-like ATPase